MILTKGGLELQIYGESHAPEIGMKLSGIKRGEKIDLKQLQKYVDRRKSSSSVYSTSRLEPDELIIKSGISGGQTTGGMINIEIKNTLARRADYDEINFIPRPGHADYPAFIKYGGKADMSGGGKFSGRLTAPLVAAGGIAVQILQKIGIKVCAEIVEIGGVKGAGLTEQMLDEIKRTKDDGDSVGGIIEAAAFNIPVGLGGALFDGIESSLSALLFGVPAVKGVEFGAGFNFAQMKGSEANDAYYYDGEQVLTKTNNNGGILGGMTNGAPINCRVVIKPTPSIAKVQDSVNLKTKRNVKLEIKGRHDACIVPRAVVVIESCLALAILDSIYQQEEQ